MNTTIEHLPEAELETLRALVHDPSLATDFDKFTGTGGLEHKLHDPRLVRDALRLARVDGEPAGFGVLWRLPQATGTWSMMRVGVLGRFRRRGVGRALAEAILDDVRAEAGGAPPAIAGSAWMPQPGAEALAARLGFEHVRWFWLMERPRGGCPAPEWPAGVTVRAFDGSEAMLREWTDCYNDSFSEHFRFVRGTLEQTRMLAGDPTFRADGLLLAYRDGVPAGFCRDEVHATRGEVGVLGVSHAARGIGLGRALLRWGVHWLEAASPNPVTLLVDGENENALGLYRSEGFEIARTRRIWELPARP